MTKRYSQNFLTRTKILREQRNKIETLKQNKMAIPKDLWIEYNSNLEYARELAKQETNLYYTKQLMKSR